MYDIQNALRRREMAERLKTLARAESTTRAAAAETTDAPVGPRHLAEPAPRPSRSRSSAPVEPPLPAQPTGSPVALRAPDQTARLEMSAVRIDRSAPPPLRAEPDPPVPPGVTLLRDSLDLPPSEPLTVVDSRAPIPAETQASPGPSSVGPADAPPVSSPDEVPDDPPLGGSSASTIADLLRHGSSGLFFRNGTA